MNYLIGTASNGSTGTHQFTGFNFLPTKVTIVASQLTGVNETYAHQSIGWGAYDVTNGYQQGVSTIIQDKSDNGDTNLNSTDIIWLKKYSGTSVVTAIRASLVSFDTLGGGMYGMTLNFSTADINYSFLVIAEG